MFLSITTGRQAGLFSTPFSTAELKNQSMCDLAQRDPTHAQFKKKSHCGNKRGRWSPAGFSTTNAASGQRTVDFGFMKTEHFPILPLSK